MVIRPKFTLSILDVINLRIFGFSLTLWGVGGLPCTRPWLCEFADRLGFENPTIMILIWTITVAAGPLLIFSKLLRTIPKQWHTLRG